MADKTPDPTPDPTPNPDEVEAKYWATFEEKLGGKLDTWFEGKMDEIRKTTTSRTGGRTTIPGLFANLIFGPEKDTK